MTGGGSFIGPYGTAAATLGGGSFIGPYGTAAAKLGGGSFIGPYGTAAAKLGGGSFIGPYGTAAAKLGGGSFIGPYGTALAEHTDTRSRTITPNFRTCDVRELMSLSPGGDNSALQLCFVRVTQKVHRRYNKSGIRKKFFHKYLFPPRHGNKNMGTSGQFWRIFALQPEIPPLAAISTGIFAAKMRKRDGRRIRHYAALSRFDRGPYSLSPRA
jgi:hypothetical protein